MANCFVKQNHHQVTSFSNDRVREVLGDFHVAFGYFSNNELYYGAEKVILTPQKDLNISKGKPACHPFLNLKHRSEGDARSILYEDLALSSEDEEENSSLEAFKPIEKVSNISKPSQVVGIKVDKMKSDKTPKSTDIKPKDGEKDRSHHASKSSRNDRARFDNSSKSKPKEVKDVKNGRHSRHLDSKSSSKGKPQEVRNVVGRHTRHLDSKSSSKVRELKDGKHNLNHDSKSSSKDKLIKPLDARVAVKSILPSREIQQKDTKLKATQSNTKGSHENHVLKIRNDFRKKTENSRNKHIQNAFETIKVRNSEQPATKSKSQIKHTLFGLQDCSKTSQGIYNSHQLATKSKSQISVTHGPFTKVSSQGHRVVSNLSAKRSRSPDKLDSSKLPSQKRSRLLSKEQLRLKNQASSWIESAKAELCLMKRAFCYIKSARFTLEMAVSVEKELSFHQASRFYFDALETLRVHGNCTSVALLSISLKAQAVISNYLYKMFAQENEEKIKLTPCSFTSGYSSSFEGEQQHSLEDFRLTASSFKSQGEALWENSKKPFSIRRKQPEFYKFDQQLEKLTLLSKCDELVLFLSAGLNIYHKRQLIRELFDEV